MTSRDCRYRRAVAADAGKAGFGGDCPFAGRLAAPGERFPKEAATSPSLRSSGECVLLRRIRFGRATGREESPVEVREVAAQRNAMSDPGRLPLRPPAHPDFVRRRIRPAERAGIVPKHLCRFPEQLSYLVRRHAVPRLAERPDSRRHSFLLSQRRCSRRPGEEQPRYARGGRNRDRSCTPRLRHSPQVCPGPRERSFHLLGFAGEERRIASESRSSLAGCV
jgi:hypothetical protein